MRRLSTTALAALRGRFQAQGFAVVEGLLSARDLAALRAQCDALVADAAAQQQPGDAGWVARERGCIFELPVTPEACCDAAAFRARCALRRSVMSTRLWTCRLLTAACCALQAERGNAACRLLFCEPLSELASALLLRCDGGDGATSASEALQLCLFNEQHIVKPPHSGEHAAFAWHRDAAWCREQARSRQNVQCVVLHQSC
jgi:hypothetical protein